MLFPVDPKPAPWVMLELPDPDCPAELEPKRPPELLLDPKENPVPLEVALLLAVLDWPNRIPDGWEAAGAPKVDLFWEPPKRPVPPEDAAPNIGENGGEMVSEQIW